MIETSFFMFSLVQFGRTAKQLSMLSLSGSRPAATKIAVRPTWGRAIPWCHGSMSQDAHMNHICSYMFHTTICYMFFRIITINLILLILLFVCKFNILKLIYQSMDVYISGWGRYKDFDRCILYTCWWMLLTLFGLLDPVYREADRPMRLCFGQARQENVLSTEIGWRLIQRWG